MFHSTDPSCFSFLLPGSFQAWQNLNVVHWSSRKQAEQVARFRVSKADGRLRGPFFFSTFFFVPGSIQNWLIQWVFSCYCRMDLPDREDVWKKSLSVWYSKGYESCSWGPISTIYFCHVKWVKWTQPISNRSHVSNHSNKANISFLFFFVNYSTTTMQEIDGIYMENRRAPPLWRQKQPWFPERELHQTQGWTI